MLVVQGTDAGGHGLAQGASLMTLLPEVRDLLEEEMAGRSGGGVANEEGGAEGGGGKAKTEPVLVAAGGICEGRSAGAALVLGGAGLVMGTRFLAAREAVVSKGYREEVLRASDGGQTTVRTKVYDECRGTTGWAETHNARGVVNRTVVDARAGMSSEENKRLYEVEMGKGDEGWGVEGRMTTYAGSGVGLVKEIKSAGEIVDEVREGARDALAAVQSRV